MPSDGSIKFPAPPPPPPIPKTPKTPNPALSSFYPPRSGSGSSLSLKDGSGSSTPTSFSSQVPDLCRRLGFVQPQYKLTTLTEGSGLWNCYADFSGDPRVDDKVGEIKNVYGKKNAKEESAKLVIQFLRDIQRQRMEGID